MSIINATGAYNMMPASDLRSRLVCSVNCSDIRTPDKMKTKFRAFSP
ncbi:MAG: hypothetical protein LBN20_04135 [Endomicrobium sp.]|nr:hypothetical protein [Endomicrobium sp.]